MRVLQRWPALGAAGLILLSAPCFCLMETRSAPPPLPALLPAGRAASCTPSLRSLRAAAYWRTQAAQRVDDLCDEECTQLKLWDPNAPFAFKERRQQLLADDREGLLRRAQRATALAAALARNPREERQAAREQVLLARDAGQR